MAAFGLALDAPLAPNVDAFVDPEKDEDKHTAALNAVLLSVHRGGPGALDALIGAHMGDYLTNDDPKLRERGTLLLAELLSRLTALPLAPASVPKLAEFFSARLADYPSVRPALTALAALLRHHETRLPEGAAAATAASVADAVCTELVLPSVAQPIRQAGLELLRNLLAAPRLRAGLSGTDMLPRLCEQMAGEKDPRCLVAGLQALRLAQQHLPDDEVAASAEAVFDATACYFPVTFTPPPGDPHGITAAGLRASLAAVMLGHPSMAGHVLPLLVGKLRSSVAAAQADAMATAAAAAAAWGCREAGVARNLEALGEALYDESVHGDDAQRVTQALDCLTSIGASAAAAGGNSWSNFASGPLRSATQEVLESPEALRGRAAAAALAALAASSARGLRAALTAAARRLLAIVQNADAASGGSANGMASVTAARRHGALEALILLLGAVDDRVDLSATAEKAPLEPYATDMFQALCAVVDRRGAPASRLPPPARAPVAMATPTTVAVASASGASSGGALTAALEAAAAGGWATAPGEAEELAARPDACVAIEGLALLATRPPAPLLPSADVQSLVRRLTALAVGVNAAAGGGSGGWGGSAEESGAAQVRRAAMAALKAVGGCARTSSLVMMESVPQLLGALQIPDSAAGGNGSNGVGDGFGAAAAAALEALAELCSVPAVFYVVTPALLALAVRRDDAAASAAVAGTAEAGSATLQAGPAAEAILRSMAAVLRASRETNKAGVLAFARGTLGAVAEKHSGSIADDVIQVGSAIDDEDGETAVIASCDGVGSDNGTPALVVVGGVGLPLLTEAVASGSPEVGAAPRTTGPPSAVALAAVADMARVCTQAAPPSTQDVLLNMVLKRFLPSAPAAATAAGDDDAKRRPRLWLLLPLLTAVLESVDSSAAGLRHPDVLEGALPLLLAGAAARGSSGGSDGGDGNNGEEVRWCCRCVGALLNKLPAGVELDTAVASTLAALRGDGKSGAAAGTAQGPHRPPTELLVWATRAVVMRGGPFAAYAALIDMLSSQIGGESGGDDGGSGGRSAEVALAAAEGFAVVVGGAVDAEWTGGRASPLWQQRLFVTAFPRLTDAATAALAATASFRDPTAETTGGDGGGKSPMDVDGAEDSSSSSLSGVGAGSGGRKNGRGGGSATVAPLMAMLLLAKSVPRSVLESELPTVMTAAVRALGSGDSDGGGGGSAPLARCALETLLALCNGDDIDAIVSPHVPTLVPKLLELTREPAGPRTRIYALQVLRELARLPYPRLHPHRPAVARGLAAALDDRRRVVRQAAARARNDWLVLRS